MFFSANMSQFIVGGVFCKKESQGLSINYQMQGK